MNIHATTLYGSNTWDILSPDCERLYKSFNVTMRHVLKIDRCTHRYIIEPLSDCLHLKTVIAARYATFHQSLVKSKKLPVRFLARIAEKDKRTVLGKTLSSLKQLCGMRDEEDLTARIIKKKLKYMDIPPTETWRVSLCKELLSVQEGSQLMLPGFSKDECDELLEYACVT